MRKPAGVIVLGEALVDLTVGAREEPGGGLAMTARAGGSPANVAVGLARLGIPTRFAGRISRDGLGPFLRAHLEQSGVDVKLCVDAPQPATVAIVGVDDTGTAAYSFYVEGTADWQWERWELPTNDAGAAIHTGSLAIALEPGAQIVAAWIAEQSARGDAFISLDPNVRPALVLELPGYRERLDGPLGILLRKLDTRGMRTRAREQITKLGITTVRDMTRRVETLSGGQRQAVAVARAAAFGSKVIILDEPTAALGVRESNQVLELIKELRRQGMPVILISHNMPHVFEVADRIHIQRLGRCVGIVTPRTHTMEEAVAIMTGASVLEPGS